MPAEIDTPQPGLGRRLVRNVLWNFGGQLWALALAFFTMPYIVGKLGTDAYGLLMTVGIVTNYFWFMDLGLGQATVKYVAEHAARNEWEEVNRIFWTSLVSYLVLGTLAALVLVAIAPLCVTLWFQIPVDLQDEALSVFYLSAIGFIIGMVNNAPTSIPKALQRFDIVNKVSVSVGTAQTLATVFLLWQGFSVREVVLGNLAVIVVSLVVNTVITHALLPKTSPPTMNFRVFKRLLRFGSSISVHIGLGSVLEHTDKLFISSLKGVGVLSFFIIPYNLVARMWALPKSLYGVLLPSFSHFHGKQSQGDIEELFLKATRWTLILVIPVMAFVLVFAHDFLNLWMGIEFANHGALAFQILGFSYFIWSISWPSYAALQGLGRPGLIVKIQLIATVIYLPTSFFAVDAFGITGAALVWLVRTSLEGPVVMAVFYSLTQFNLKRLVRILSRSLSILGVVCFTLIATRILLQPLLNLSGALGIIIVAVPILGVVYPCLGYLWLLNGTEKQVVSQPFDLLIARSRGRA